MEYVVLARRFRPQCFREIVGQEAIVATLKNALRFNRAAHAYLFSGARGVGKTTLARIFAKALNCLSRTEDFEPCNSCASCLEIMRGQSLDCLEIDGASNRGIDEIRTLNETVAYTPAHGRYKITIIDEVHMLTKEAFNALLKTLEEPPEHAKFFFATTEPHRVLPTIVSRCQRFDLRRITEEEIVKSLASITTQMNREIEPGALKLIASFSEGSLRDAESLLDQLFCFSNGVISANDVRSLLGLASEELFSELDAAFAEGKVSFAFELTERLFREGKQFSHFAEQLISHYRLLATSRLSGVTHPVYTSAQLLYILDYLVNSFDALQKSPWQRIALEAQLLHILRSKNRIPTELLVRRLSELEEKLSLPQHALPSSPNIDSPLPKEEPSPLQIPPELPVVDNSEPAEEELGEHSSDAKDALLSAVSLPDKTPLPSSADKAPQSVKPVSSKESLDSSPPVKKTLPGHYETLLQFSAIELEGSLK